MGLSGMPLMCSSNPNRDFVVSLSSTVKVERLPSVLCEEARAQSPPTPTTYRQTKAEPESELCLGEDVWHANITKTAL